MTIVLMLASLCMASKVTTITLGVGDSSVVSVAKPFAQSSVISSDPQVLEVERAPVGFRATAHRPGSGFVTLNAGGKVKRFDFAVKPYAAQFPTQLSATVNGLPAIPGTVQGAIESSLKQTIKCAPMAKLSFKFTNVPTIGAGMMVMVPVKVNIEAPGTLPRRGQVTVKVTNLGLVGQADDVLWYCNDPERVAYARNLFSAELEAGKSARLLYHHINVAPMPIVIRTLVFNNSDAPATVVLTPGDSAPDRDPVGAGLKAGDLYFRAWRSQSGEVVTIPPKSCIPISFRRLKPQEVISGLCSIRSVEGASLLVRTDSVLPTEIEPKWVVTYFSSTPWRETGPQPIRSWDMTHYELSDHVYPIPFKSETATYTVGGRYAVVRLGQVSISRQDSSGRLDGNFGVIYEVELNLSNPTTHKADVEVTFETSAGYSGGLFSINGRYLMTPKMLPKKLARIAKYSLAAGEKRKVQLTTMPLSGSSYPATLFVRLLGSGPTKNVLDLTK
ncbi:MAG TPA: hypothetical protein VK171_10500 [Fimbriimonas sp.]|nr:hypothetical protein [Fimbriimonas sp.]